MSVLNSSVVCSLAFACVGRYSDLLTHTHTQAGTHSDGLVQWSFVLLLELYSDLHQVDFTARNHDPGHHLLLRSFTLQRDRKNKMEDNQQTSKQADWRRTLCTVLLLLTQWKCTFIASLSLLAKYSCLFSKHSTVKRRRQTFNEPGQLPDVFTTCPVLLENYYVI